MELLRDDDDLDAYNLIQFGIPRIVYNRADYFNTFDPLTFFQRFRVTRPTALRILNIIEADVEYPYNLNNSVAPINQLLIFLRFCATGTHLSCIGDFAGTHLNTVSRIIVRVSRYLALRYNEYIKMPEAQEQILNTQMQFYNVSRFPRVIGVVDCTHIKIQSPGGEDAEVYRNRKGYFSLNVQVVGNSNLEIMNEVSRWPGSTHDVPIFNNSQIRQEFERNRYTNSLLLGDSGYYLKPYLLTPLLNPVTEAEHLYNQAHIRTRNAIGRLFGVWKRRFPILAYGCRLKIDTTMAVIIATAVIYNICKLNNEEEPPDPDNVGRFLELMEEHEVPDVPLPNNNLLPLGNQVRRNFIENYFSNL